MNDTSKHSRKFIALVFIVLALVTGFLFFREITFPEGLEDYFRRSYYNQFGPLALCVELLIAGLYLFRMHPKLNFTLALFGFTALLDPVFNQLGLFSSNTPLYATVLFALCAVLCLWIAFTDTYKSGRISLVGAIFSFLLGNLIEFFFNY